MDIHLLTGQLQTSSHQLEIEVGKYANTALEKRIYQLCHQGVESEEHYICNCLDNQVFYSLRELMEYKDQWCLGLSLIELKRHGEILLKNSNTNIQAY